MQKDLFIILINLAISIFIGYHGYKAYIKDKFSGQEYIWKAKISYKKNPKGYHLYQWPITALYFILNFWLSDLSNQYKQSWANLVQFILLAILVIYVVASYRRIKKFENR